MARSLTNRKVPHTSHAYSDHRQRDTSPTGAMASPPGPTLAMRIAIIGNGQLGSALEALLRTDPTWQGSAVTVLGHDTLDIRDAAAVEAKLGELAAELVINAAAYNQVDEAEMDPETAFAVNAIGPGRLARAARVLNARLVHVSTDYVFSGELLAGQVTDSGYREADLPAPRSVYGASKLAGEHRVLANAPDALVVRTSGVYGPRPDGRGKRSFVEAILAQAEAGTALRVVNDQRLGPTYAVDLAAAILALARLPASGLIHASNAGSCSWYEFARAILELAGSGVPIEPVPSSARPTPAYRPPYSVLDNGRLRELGIEMPRWRDALARYMHARMAEVELLATPALRVAR